MSRSTYAQPLSYGGAGWGFKVHGFLLSCCSSSYGMLYFLSLSFSSSLTSAPPRSSPSPRRRPVLPLPLRRLSLGVFPPPLACSWSASLMSTWGRTPRHTARVMSHTHVLVALEKFPNRITAAQSQSSNALCRSESEFSRFNRASLHLRRRRLARLGASLETFRLRSAPACPRYCSRSPSNAFQSVWQFVGRPVLGGQDLETDGVVAHEWLQSPGGSIEFLAHHRWDGSLLLSALVPCELRGLWRAEGGETPLGVQSRPPCRSRCRRCRGCRAPSRGARRQFVLGPARNTRFTDWETKRASSGGNLQSRRDGQCRRQKEKGKD